MKIIKIFKGIKKVIKIASRVLIDPRVLRMTNLGLELISLKNKAGVKSSPKIRFLRDLVGELEGLSSDNQLKLINAINKDQSVFNDIRVAMRQGILELQDKDETVTYDLLHKVVNQK